MGRRSRFPGEVRQRAMRLVMEGEGQYGSQWSAIKSVAAKIKGTSETLRKWVRQAERDAGMRPGLSTAERERPKDLERENRDLKRANAILRKASAFFAQAELDRCLVRWRSPSNPLNTNEESECPSLKHSH